MKPKEALPLFNKIIFLKKVDATKIYEKEGGRGDDWLIENGDVELYRGGVWPEEALFVWSKRIVLKKVDSTD